MKIKISIAVVFAGALLLGVTACANVGNRAEVCSRVEPHARAITQATNNATENRNNDPVRKAFAKVWLEKLADMEKDLVTDDIGLQNALSQVIQNSKISATEYLTYSGSNPDVTKLEQANRNFKKGLLELAAICVATES